ncbi:hypothetical protein SDC9_179660 [bioreactor metagenome]|uniref:Uncharacterized protein n=1 Tax=bioreactor metagenome TaxID=1076179 RepID=A0A645H7D6_9ZZZZ
MMAYNHAITVSNQKTKKPQEVIEILCDFEKAWANADNKERHGMLTNLIAAIRISRQNEIEIDFL